MPLLQHCAIEEGRRGWALWQLDEELPRLAGLLADKELPACAARRHSHPGKQREWLAVRLLLQTVLGSDKKIEYLPSGRPLLADGSFYISISHTAGYVALSYDACAPTGVDVEQQGDRVCRIAPRFLSPGELEGAPAAAADRQNYLLLCWSAKEAAFKIIDRRGVDFREQMQIPPFALQPQGKFALHQTATAAAAAHLTVGYRVHPRFVFTCIFTAPE